MKETHETKYIVCARGNHGTEIADAFFSIDYAMEQYKLLWETEGIDYVQMFVSVSDVKLMLDTRLEKPLTKQKSVV